MTIVNNRCPEHPEFDTQNGSLWSRKCYQECPICTGLFYGLKEVGYLDGEKAIDNGIIGETGIILYASDIRQFGQMRFFISSGYHSVDNPFSWFIDMPNKIIYFNRSFTLNKLKDFPPEWTITY